MDHVLVRYGELGTKSSKVSSDMKKVLRQRVEDRLVYEKYEFESVSTSPSRIICSGVDRAEEAAKAVSEIPGVASASPVTKTGCGLDEIKQAVKTLEVGETFGIDANSVKGNLGSQELEKELGTYVLNLGDYEVDLDNPNTWIRVDVRHEDAFVYVKEFEGPHGFPVGTGDPLVALISGGIDSPVAAYEVMKRGSDIVPVYFYNKPFAAEDHLIRFLAVIKKLKRINPSRDWKAYVVDMEAVNEKLLDNIDSGRMLVHRRIMFKVAEEIVGQESLSGIVTGESLGQKSSQTASNLDLTSKAVETSIFRPLLTENKHDIVRNAKDFGTFEEAKIDSACQTMAPDFPATKMGEKEIEVIEEELGMEKLVEKAIESIDIKEV